MIFRNYFPDDNFCLGAQLKRRGETETLERLKSLIEIVEKERMYKRENRSDGGKRGKAVIKSWCMFVVCLSSWIFRTTLSDHQNTHSFRISLMVKVCHRLLLQTEDI